jgi:hypothetical protein
MIDGKGKPKQSPGLALRLLRTLWLPHNRGLVLTAAVVLAAVGGARYGWRRWGEAHAQASDYVITPEKISLTPLPAWIRCDLKGEVLRTASLAKLNLREAQLVEHIAQAFSLHPWVAKVLRVSKRYPAEIRVDLAYRQPVAVVKLNMPDERGLLFIDAEGVLLPSDFAPSEAKNYLRILAAGETPAGVYGTPWGSDRIAGAARVAAAWGDRWKTLGLYWLAANPASDGNLIYELRPQDEKVRVIWGSPPGAKTAGEPLPADKIAALERLVHEKGALDRADAPAVIDLRTLAEPRTAAEGTRKRARR